MPLLSSSLRAVRGTTFASIPKCRFYSSQVAKEGEIVLLKNISSTTSKPILSRPLYPGGKISLQGDSISHEDIIGKELGGDCVVSRRKTQWRIHRPTLGEYTDNSPRIVTPIYSQDASLIVSLLDLNPSVPETNDEKLEIFEAGTGHGALTLFLARAIHAANTAAPEIVEGVDVDVEKSKTYEEWQSKRRAVVHTLDISEKHSNHARTVVKNFRGGMYYPHVDFHVGGINEYVISRLSEANGEPVFDHAILDLPDTHSNLDIVSKALKPNGLLITFSPSITQINSCYDLVKEHRLPLFLDPVLEIGGMMGVGGREWDVRRVRVRDSYPGKAVEKDDVLGEQDGEKEGIKGDTSDPDVNPEVRWEMICRPKVGVKVVGGGFIGVWRKKSF